MKQVLALIVLALAVTGCMGSKTTIVKDGMKVTTTYEGDVTEHVVYSNQRERRDAATENMYEKQGITMTNKMYYLSDGSQAFLPESITVRAPHRWQQEIETKPPESPGWQLAHRTLDTADKGLSGLLLDKILGTTDGSQSTRYHGDYSPQTAEPFVVHPEIVEPVVVEPTIVE